MVARQMKFRDVQVAEDIGQMAELGWFDVEFTVYGCAYLNPADSKMYYKVSTQAEDIYQFMEQAVLQKIYPGNVVKLSKKQSVPSGMKELITQDVKMDLARLMRQTYPKEFFLQLNKIAGYCVENHAADLLWNEAKELEGVFDKEKLCRFEELVHYTYSCHKINEAAYQQLITWIKEEQSNMDEDGVIKDLFEKTMYAIAYEENDRIHYMTNAQKDYIYEKSYLLEQQGLFVTPVFSKTYWYNYEYRLSDVIRDFKGLTREVLDFAYIEKLKKIRSANSEAVKELFQNLLDETGRNWDKTCLETLMRYKNHWGI